MSSSIIVILRDPLRHVEAMSLAVSAAMKLRNLPAERVWWAAKKGVMVGCGLRCADADEWLAVLDVWVSCSYAPRVLCWFRYQQSLFGWNKSKADGGLLIERG